VASDTTLPVRLKVAPAPIMLVVSSANAAIINAVAAALQPFGLTPCVTSGIDGVHSRSSKHYANQAVDFRVADWPDAKRDSILKAIHDTLPANFKYIWEGDHLHVHQV
jgi:hypothetical protein